MKLTTLADLLTRGPKNCENCAVEFIGDSSKKVCGPCSSVLMKEGVLRLKDGSRRRIVGRRPEVRV